MKDCIKVLVRDQEVRDQEVRDNKSLTKGLTKGIHKKKINKSKVNYTKKALVIGINYRGTKSQLSGCINDANKMVNYLITKCGFKESDIIMLSDHVGARHSQLPTKANIIRNINWLTSNIHANDDCQLVFHYSGHGSNTADQNKDEVDGRDETICPVDYPLHGDIIDDDLKMMLVDSLPSNAKLFCLMDCCHSGTGLDLRYGCRVYNNKNSLTYSLTENKRDTKSKGEVILFSGCRDNQYSADAYIKRKYQGAMTWAFFEILSRHHYAPVKLSDLITEIRDLLVKHDYDQIPQLSSGRMINLNETFCLTD
ncbi:MAG: caspase family protein [Methylococcales bacterium]